MRKTFGLILALVMIFAVAGCNNNNVSKMDVDTPVTADQVNTASDFVVRGFLESVFTNNRDLFVKCFPESLIEETEKAGIDLFAQYTEALEDDGKFVGTQYLNYNELSIDGGYSDAESYRADIAKLVGTTPDEIKSMHIDHIKVYFEVEGTNRYSEIYAIAYEYSGAWYMYELQNSESDFGKK